jgi:hypothetical protein
MTLANYFQPARTGSPSANPLSRHTGASDSASNLRSALELTTRVTDIGITLKPLTRVTLWAIHVRYRGGRLTTPWNHLRVAGFTKSVAAVL